MKDTDSNSDRLALQPDKDAVEAVKKILLEEIELAKPDDLAFLEWQVPSIAGRIVRSFRD